jgi:hypothetical protein
MHLNAAAQTVSALSWMAALGVSPSPPHAATNAPIASKEALDIDLISASRTRGGDGKPTCLRRAAGNVRSRRRSRGVGVTSANANANARRSGDRRSVILIGIVRVMVLVLVVGCSNPARRDPVPRAGDPVAAAGPDAADGAAGDAAIGAAIDAAIAAPPPDAAAATFPWQKLRDAYEASRSAPGGSHPCDPRHPDAHLTPGCPPMKMREHAALLLGKPQRRADRSYVALVDRGRDDGVRVGWRAALLDGRERVIAGWTAVRAVDKHRSTIDVPASWLAHEAYRNIALVEHRP